jgi:anti-sigma regulatory factor (Ser/Thr protein kinase)
MKKPLNEELPKEITLPATADSVRGLIDFVTSHCREMGFDDKRIGDIELALAETFDNILRFSCCSGNEEISIECEVHEMGALLLNIIDTGKPYNMLVLSAFPDVAGEAEVPSTKIMKKVVKNIEYRRDGARKANILFWTVFG